jgi:hypothetical protein
MALGSRFGEQVCRIAALGQQLCRTVLGHNFGEQRRGTALGSNFGHLSRPALRQLRVTALEFWERFWDAAFGSNFEEQLLGASVGSTFAALKQH